MKRPRLPARLEAAFWEKSRGLRRRLRDLLGRLSRRRKKLRGGAVPEPRAVELAPLAWPPVPGGDPDAQYFAVIGEPAEAPAGALEALLLVAAAEDLDLAEAGWAEPSAVAGAPPGEIRPFAGGALLVRRRPAGPRREIRGKVVPFIGGPGAEQPSSWPFFRKSGAYRFPADGGALARTYTPRVDLRLIAMPELEGPPTVLFLLPFLAVGGAERLLFDLLASWRGYRVLIVTVEPHAASLGETAGRARQLTPHLFTLGDWLPRETHLGALFHLLRVYRVASLVSFNGTIFFYDTVAAIRGQFPRLRILAQLFHHEGGFFSRSGPAARAAIDGHFAVNRAIAAALEQELAVPADRIYLLHHGVELPSGAAATASAEGAEKKRELRERLGLPPDALVAGTFIRLHAQKRPLDVVALARRLAPRGVFFLLVGGGPLESELEAELAARPAPNLVRLPLVADARELYPAIDICLLTSAYEGLPIFLLDGLARGIPCVSTAVGEVPELLAEGGGACAPVGDLAALGAAIEMLMDPARRRQEGERGRRTVAERFSLAAFAAAYETAIFPPGGN